MTTHACQDSGIEFETKDELAEIKRKYEMVRNFVKKISHNEISWAGWKYDAKQLLKELGE